MALTLKERCSKRLEGLKSSRQPYEADWKEIARHAAPNRARFLNSETGRNTRRARVYNDHAIWAFRTLTGGMASGLSSESRPWFNLELEDRDLMKAPAVKAWLDDTETRMYAFLATSNFYSAAKFGYSEMGQFGTEACVMEEGRAGSPVQYVCHPLTVGEYWIALSSEMIPDTLYRRIPMNVLQAVQHFGDKVRPWIRDQYDRSNYAATIDVVQAIEPNLERDTKRLDWRGKPFRSIYWEEADTRPGELLREQGFDEQPFWAPRWDVVGCDVYGSSPGFDILPSMRELQLYTKRRAELVDQITKPEMVVPAGVKLTGMPGNKVSAAATEIAGMKSWVPYVPEVTALVAAREDIAKLETTIDVGTYAELFMAITNMPGVQPRNIEEIAARNEEKLTQLGPVVGNVNGQKLSIALDRAFAIMARRQMLLPPPEEIHGMDIKFSFISILTQMQRAIGVGQIERVAGFVGNLMGVFPEAGDKLNTDAMIDEFGERIGVPSQVIRSPEEVAQIRTARAQAAQAEKTAAMMPAVQQGADAARLLSETDVGGLSMLDRVMPV